MFHNHFTFVNYCLTILYGNNLPSYCYYDNEFELNTFYNDITEKDKVTIYIFLVRNSFINPKNITQTQFTQNFRTTIESFLSN